MLAYKQRRWNTQQSGQAEFPDDQAPTGTLKIDNATASTTSSSVTLNMTASDNKGVVGYLASESSAPPSVDSPVGSALLQLKVIQQI